MTTTTIPQTQTTAPPEGNPEKVRITDEMMCSLNGWTPGGVYPTIEHEINVKDANGFEIYVMSSTWNKPVYLAHTHYELVNNETNS